MADICFASTKMDEVKYINVSDVNYGNERKYRGQERRDGATKGTPPLQNPRDD